MKESSSGASSRGALAELKEAVSHLFEQVVGMAPDLGLTQDFPRHEVKVEDNAYRVQLELPGVGRDDIDVAVAGRRLNISGERKRPEPPPEARVLRSERRFGTFELDLQLPAEVDPVGVVAQMRDGVLEVRLPKLTASRGRSVHIETPGDRPDSAAQPPPGAETPGPDEPGGEPPPPSGGGAEGETGETGHPERGPMPWEDDTTL